MNPDPNAHAVGTDTLPPRWLGPVLIAGVLCLLVWLAAGVLIQNDRRQTLDAEVARNTSLTLAHEQGVARSLQWLDQLLVVLRRDYRRQGRELDLNVLVKDLGIDLSHINNVVVIDARGEVLRSLYPGMANVAERPYFQQHHDALSDELVVGPVLMGKISDRWSVTLSRRMVDSQGRFDGVVLLAVQPELFTGLFLKSSLRPHDSVELVGLDGEVRARRVGEVVSFGGQLPSSTLFSALTSAAQGHFQGIWNAGTMAQLVSYRTVLGAPLVVVVASALDDALAPADFRMQVILVSAGLASALFLLLARLVLRARYRQYEATQRIAYNEARYRWLFEHMLDGVMGLDLAGQIRAVNPAACALLGLEQDQLLGSALWQHAVGQAHDTDAWREQLRRTGRAHEVCRFAPPGGQAFDAEVSSVLPQAPGQAAGSDQALVTVVMRDVSSRRQAEEAQRRQAVAEQASQAKNAFMSRMSHELRTPLNAILGFAQLLERDPRSPLAPHQQEQIQHVLRAGRHLLVLINEVLDLSQVEGGHLQLRLQSVDLHSLSQEVLAALSDEASRAGISLNPLESEQASDCPPVWADPVRLRQVLYNLVSNAIKYGHPGGWVRLDLRVYAQTCRLEVCDNGLGLSASQLSALFQPFNRLGREHSGLPGTGIGLVISRRLVELMRGALTVRSEAGLGSVFGVELPRAGEQTLPLSAQEEPTVNVSHRLPTSAPGRAAQGRVLLVEDDLANQAVIKGCLGYRPQLVLEVAGSAAQAKAMAAAHWPDLALIDMMLPDGSGLDVLEALRGLAGSRGLRCVAVSANAMPGQVKEALEAGFDAYLTKPVQFEQLLAEVDRSLPSKS